MSGEERVAQYHALDPDPDAVALGEMGGWWNASPDRSFAICRPISRNYVVEITTGWSKSAGVTVRMAASRRVRGSLPPHAFEERLGRQLGHYFRVFARVGTKR